MNEQPVHLVVHFASACGLLKQGDRWLVNGQEVTRVGQARICATGLWHIYPKLKNLLNSLPPDAKATDDILLCDNPGCDAAFRVEFATLTAPLQAATAPAPALASGGTRRLQRGADLATTLLRRHGPFLSRLSKELAAELITLCATRHYEDKEIILTQGVVGEHLYIVGEGEVEVVRMGKGVDETVLVTLGVAECFGEMSILTGEMTSAEVRSRGPSAILSIHKADLEGLLLKRPALSREFSRLLADRLKATNQSLESELSRGVLGKLSMISFIDLVQTLHHSRRTGTLVLNYAGQQARVGFHEGTVRTAATGETCGDEAFYEIVVWPEGDFCFETESPPEDASRFQVQTDTIGLLMESLRRMDEVKASESGLINAAPTPETKAS